MNNTFALNHYFLLSYRMSFNRILGFKTILLLGFLLTFFLTLFYTIQYSNMMKAGFLIKNYGEKIESLYQENENLEINFASVTSLDNVKKMASELGFEKTENIRYIKVLENAFVTTKK